MGKGEGPIREIEKELETALPETRCIRISNTDNIDYFFVILFLVLGLYSRLVMLEHPNSVVFDEQHFGSFTNSYLSGKYFFDIHPPLGKLIFYVTSLWCGYNGEYRFQTQGEVYTNGHYITLRAVPAIFGGLLIPLIYLTARQMRLSASISALGLHFWMIIIDDILFLNIHLINMKPNWNTQHE